MNMRAIATRAGVSLATVSRVLNGFPPVKEEKAVRVRKVLAETDFMPNPLATTLRYGRTKTYGLIISDIRNPFYSELLAEFEELLAETDHEVLLSNVGLTAKPEKMVRRMLMRKVEGVVMMASELDTHALEPLLLRKVPLVTIDHRSTRAGCSDVAVDFDFGFLEAVKHLIELGHRRLGFIGGTEGLRTSRVRLDGFKAAVQKRGLTFYPSLIRTGNYRISGGEEAIFSLMKERTRPTAVLTANDVTAFGAIRGLHKLGLSVPNDLSIVGLDDVLLCSVIQPSLTTIGIPRRKMAQVCLAALLTTKKDVGRCGSRYTVPTTFVARESTAQLIRRYR